MHHPIAETYVGRAILSVEDRHAQHAVPDVLVDAQFAIDRTGLRWGWGGRVEGRPEQLYALAGKTLAVTLDEPIRGFGDPHARAVGHALLTSVGPLEYDRPGRTRAQLVGIGPAPFDALGPWPIRTREDAA